MDALVMTAAVACTIPAWALAHHIAGRAARRYRQHVHRIREQAVYRVAHTRGSSMAFVGYPCPVETPEDELLPFDPSLTGTASRLSSEVACCQALDRGLVDGWRRHAELRLGAEAQMFLAVHDRDGGR